MRSLTTLPSGIVEPAMYGVTLRLRTSMCCAMVGIVIGVWSPWY